MDKLLPAATAIKRRRLELEAEAEPTGIIPNDFSGTSGPKAKTVKKTQPVKEIKIKDAVRERKEAEEAAARREEEGLRDTLGGMTVEEMKDLAVVEEMELPQRQPPGQRTICEPSRRWDERWNGRKNFKKFRRRGEGGQARRGQSVIVPLEEVKKKDYGIGEDYWLEKESEGMKRRKKEKEKQTQSQSQLTPNTIAKSQALEIPSDLVVDDSINGTEAIDVDAPRMTRQQEKTHQSDGSTNAQLSASQMLAEKPGGRSKGPTFPLGPKKRKRFAAARDSDNESESEDEEGQVRYAKRAK